jgi:hypothetical protein
MDIQEEVKQQRVKHIVASYQLGGEEEQQFNTYLEDLFSYYPPPLIELAMVETLVDHWVTVPLLRGAAFLSAAHDKLKNWEHQPIMSTLTPEQFHQISGLDPAPVFGTEELPPNRPIVFPS